MLAHAQSSSDRREVAVILNRHARGVSPKIVHRLGRLLPRHDIFLSRSIDDSQAIAEEVVERGYQAVLLGGGDGTFVQCLNDLKMHAYERGRELPSVGVLRLGTGNALAFALDASEVNEAGLRRDLARARDRARHGQLELLEVNGRLTPFSGIGLDAMILEDFVATTRLLDRAGIGRSIGSAGRYALAVAFRSTPRYMLRRLPEVTVINRGAPAYRVVLGRVVGAPIPSGEVLYQGPCALTTGSTIPYFGFGMKMFPYAQMMPGRFQLRCASTSALEILARLPAIWRGEFVSTTLADFLVDGVELQVDRPVPLQIGGDLQPEKRDRLVLATAQPIRVVQ